MRLVGLTGGIASGKSTLRRGAARPRGSRSSTPTGWPARRSSRAPRRSPAIVRGLRPGRRRPRRRARPQGAWRRCVFADASARRAARGHRPPGRPGRRGRRDGPARRRGARPGLLRRPAALRARARSVRSTAWWWSTLPARRPAAPAAGPRRAGAGRGRGPARRPAPHRREGRARRRGGRERRRYRLAPRPGRPACSGPAGRAWRDAFPTRRRRAIDGSMADNAAPPSSPDTRASSGAGWSTACSRAPGAAGWSCSSQPAHAAAARAEIARHAPATSRSGRATSRPCTSGSPAPSGSRSLRDVIHASGTWPPPPASTRRADVSGGSTSRARATCSSWLAPRPAPAAAPPLLLRLRRRRPPGRRHGGRADARAALPRRPTSRARPAPRSWCGGPGRASRSPIYRPAIVVGDSRTGEIDRFEGPYYLAILLVTSPLARAAPAPRRRRAPLNVVPVDFVVDAALAIAREPGRRGEDRAPGGPGPACRRGGSTR